ncbi:hypothetical protein [Arthrobacter antioxidans]|uniref:hypothetical protein n=1 Tax=Arthrobacter antioxidans TaxID=2895818 RepID=UPI001FFEA5A6|nr:hypothetical protein [Arthrobacter antioxidans]
MSADSVVMPGTGDALTTHGTGTLTHDAVDAFEVTARLEASGMSDRTVRRTHGAHDVFTYARSLARPASASGAPGAPGSWPARVLLLAAVRRAVVLVLGAVLGGLTATILAVDGRQILIAGIGAWVVGQGVSGIVWAHAGAGHGPRGVARGTGVALLVAMALAACLVITLVIPGLDPTLAVLTMAWCWYSCVVSMLVILERSWFLLAVLAAAVPILTVTLVLRHDASAVIGAAVALLVLLAVTVALIGVLRTAAERCVPSRHDWKAAPAPAAQAGFLAAALSVALARLPEWEGTALIVASVVAAAATDPALVLMRQRLVWSSNRTSHLRHAARHARLVALAMSAAIVLVSAVASTLVILFLVEDPAATTVLVAAAFSSLAATSTALNAFGLARGGVVFAGAACLASVAWLALGDVPGMLCAVVFLAAGIAALLARVSDPRAYA